MTQCEGSRSILLRLEGFCGKGSEAPKDNTAQRAKVGMCSCCVKATHVLAPATYPVGQMGPVKRKALELWQRHGPYGSRGFAAGVYNNSYGALPASWDWISRTKNLEIPGPLAQVRKWMATADTHEMADGSSSAGLDPACPKMPAPPPMPEWLSQSPDTYGEPSSLRGGHSPKPPPPKYDPRSRDVKAKDSPRVPRGSRKTSDWNTDWRGTWKSSSDWNRRSHQKWPLNTIFSLPLGIDGDSRA